jgi:tRNA pseudouridine38-40 synthase
MTTMRLVLEYDGTDFHGWQWQPGIRTVEGVLRDALLQVTGEQPALTAAGRTDAGAHSHGQVVGLTVGDDWPAARLLGALNAVLPSDVSVREAVPTAPGFHARFDAESRTYRYVVASRRERSPLLRRFAWQLSGDLDLAAMRRAAGLLRGTHDFAALGRSPLAGGHTIRTVRHIALHRTSFLDDQSLPALVIEVSADAFLYGMMRGIVGMLVAVGRGRLSVAEVERLLAAPARVPTITVAPARGLHQWTVTYPAPTTETSE